MDWVRGFEYAVVGLLLAVVVLSGPLVGAVDLTSESELTGLGQGNVSVSSVSTDGSVSLNRGEYGAGAYYLSTPPARLTVTAISGQPMLVYSVEIFELNYKRSTTHFLSADDAGERTLTITRDSLAPDAVENDSYRGRIQVLARTNGTDRLLHSRNVTIEVDG
jgi:hypothetical protein